MGYYSEVGLCLNKMAHDKMLAELELQDDSTKSEVQELLADAQKHVTHGNRNEQCTAYHWPWIKWYSNYKEVKFIEDFLKQIPDDEDHELQYRFVYIGEEVDDITVHGSYFENPFQMDLGRGVYIVPPEKEATEPC